MTPRPRDAEATRQALLDAARALFARHGYEATTVRAVAERAGVNQALLFRYFGTKDGLLAEAVRGQALGLLDAGPRADLLDRLLAAVVAPAESPPVFLTVLRGTGIGALLRAELEQAYTDALADLVDTPDRADAENRAQLLLAWLLGLTVLRSTPGTRPAPPPHAVLPHLRRAAHTLLHG